MIEPKRLKGELWFFLRQVLSQGQDIHLDYLDKPYESKSARLDAAARERAEQLEAMLDAAHEHQWVISWPFDRCVCGNTRASNVRPTSDRGPNVAEQKEDYLGALLVAALGGVGVFWALKDPEGLIDTVVFCVAQLHF